MDDKLLNGMELPRGLKPSDYNITEDGTLIEGKNEQSDVSRNISEMCSMFTSECEKVGEVESILTAVVYTNGNERRVFSKKQHITRETLFDLIIGFIKTEGLEHDVVEYLAMEAVQRMMKRQQTMDELDELGLIKKVEL